MTVDMETLMKVKALSIRKQLVKFHQKTRQASRSASEQNLSFLCSPLLFLLSVKLTTEALFLTGRRLPHISRRRQLGE